MSNRFSPHDHLKFKSSVSIGSQSPVLKKDFLSEDKVSLTIDITYSFFRELQKAKCDFPELSYICILNSQLKPVHLRQCKRLEDRLRQICNEVSRIYKREGGGRQKRKLNDKVKKLAEILILKLKLFQNCMLLYLSLKKITRSWLKNVEYCKTK